MAPPTAAPKPWSENHQKSYQWLFNYYKTIYPEAKENDFIDKNTRKVMDIILNNSNWSDSSKERLLFVVSRYLHNNKKFRYSNIYQKKGIEFIKKSQDKEYKNDLDEKEKLNFREHNYFVDILNSIDYETLHSLTEHYRYLLLALLTYQPPLRTSFYTTAQFLRYEKENDKIHNFVYIMRRGKVKVQLIVNDDKVSKTKSYAMDKNLSFIKVIDEKLVKIINDSFIKYPRTYLFEMNEKPITSQLLLTWLRKITRVSEINVDIMRSSYITWYYSNHPRYGDREELSKMMRHSVPTAEKNYNKIFDNKIVENNDVNCDEVKKDLYQAEQQKDVLLNKLSAYSQTTPENKSDINHYKKKRRDILYNINKKGRIPREGTLEKYEIGYDDETGMYI